MSAHSGRLYGVGVGPGDPELITLKAARIIASADVVAYHHARGRTSIALSIAGEHVPDSAIHERLVYPVTTEAVDVPGGYHALLARFYDECAERLRAHLEAGRSVVVLAEGDPLFYGSFMYVHDALKPHFVVEVVPGITSMAAATAAVGTGLCRHEDTLTVLPGTLPVRELADRLSRTDAAVVMKLGRTFAGVVEAIRQAGLLHRAMYVERASSRAQRVLPVLDVDPASVPYMSIIVIVGEDLRADAAGRASIPAVGEIASTATISNDLAGTDADVRRDAGLDGSRLAGPADASGPPGGSHATRPGVVHVVGLGPGPERWLTPETASVLASVRHVIGYRPYVARVPAREGLTRHFSGNTVEVDRGVQALELAHAGDDVAVVSGGDPGVFAMASAVLEAQESLVDDDAAWAQVDVRVHPGVTASHAAAALVGAPLGGDHALVSLSDRLKPWAVVEARLRALVRADLAIALTHSPEPRVLERFAADGYQLSISGHTHGGQICLPGGRSIVTNCGIDRERAHGLHRFDEMHMYVSRGLGTSKYAPVRLNCPPTATLLRLTERH